MRKILIKNMEQFRESIATEGYGVFLVDEPVGNTVVCLEVDYIPKTDTFLVSDLINDGRVERLTAHELEDAYKESMLSGRFYKEID